MGGSRWNSVAISNIEVEINVFPYLHTVMNYMAGWTVTIAA